MPRLKAKFEYVIPPYDLFERTAYSKGNSSKSRKALQKKLTSRNIWKTNLLCTFDVDCRIITNHINCFQLVTFIVLTFLYMVIRITDRLNLFQYGFCILEHKWIWFPERSILQRIMVNSAYFSPCVRLENIPITIFLCIHENSVFAPHGKVWLHLKTHLLKILSSAILKAPIPRRSEGNAAWLKIDMVEVWLVNVKLSTSQGNKQQKIKDVIKILHLMFKVSHRRQEVRGEKTHLKIGIPGTSTTPTWYSRSSAAKNKWGWDPFFFPGRPPDLKMSQRTWSQIPTKSNPFTPKETTETFSMSRENSQI